MSLRTELQKVYEEHGFLTPQVLLDAARPPKHPLHSQFEWDNKKAGDMYRLEQARELIRSVKVRYRKPNTLEEEQVRFYHSVRAEKGNVYHTVDDIKANPFLSKVLLAEAERAWRDLYGRYSHLAEFLELVREDVSEAV